MTLSYDRDADVLYITFERLSNRSCVYVENDSGDILRLDKRDGQIVGCTIPFFLKRAAKGKFEIPEISSVPFNDLAKALIA